MLLLVVVFVCIFVGNVLSGIASRSDTMFEMVVLNT